MNNELYDYNNNCYYFKELNFEKGIFDELCDCCYVLLLESYKEREKTLIEQLNIYKPHKKIIIQYNKGFKNCNKLLYKQSTIYDINDAYYQVFKDSQFKNFNNVLVLEDDVLFDYRIKDQNIINDIKNLYKYHDVDMFNFGPFNYLLNPIIPKKRRFNCYKLLQASGVHAVIYSLKFKNKYIKSYESKKRKSTFDEDINFFKYGNIYTYKFPIAYQPIELTENMKNWKLLNWNASNFSIKILKLFDILENKDPIKAYNKFFKLVKIVNYIFICIILFILYKIYYFIKKNN
jgi:hypothetical protein